MSILVERASFEDRAKFFHKNQSAITRLLDDLAEPAKKPKRKKKTETKAKEKAKPKAKAKAKAKAKPKTKAKAKPKEKAKAKEKPKAKPKEKPQETPPVEEKNLSVEELVTETSTQGTPTTDTSTLDTPTAEISASIETLDDLTKIKGLGAKMVESLHVAGITKFEQLADLNEKQIVQLGKSIRGFASAYERKDFKKQAQEFNK